DWDSGEIGLSLAFVGVTSALVQWFLMDPILKRFGLVRTALSGYAINIIGMTAYAFAFAPWMVYPIIAFTALAGVTTPAMNTIMSNLTPDDAQGELHAASASLNALAISIAPILLTQTLYYFSSGVAPVYFPGAAFLLAAVLVVCALVPILVGFGANKDRVEMSEP
ncbi:MAG: MFS transporter, partial [Pseudomonadota bacterium]